MKNTEILGINNPLPERPEQPVTEDQRLQAQLDEVQAAIDERLAYEKEQHAQLAQGGYDYFGRETLRAMMGQLLGRFY
jgi:hypothetical protein